MDSCTKTLKICTLLKNIYFLLSLPKQNAGGEQRPKNRIEGDEEESKI